MVAGDSDSDDSVASIEAIERFSRHRQRRRSSSSRSFFDFPQRLEERLEEFESRDAEEGADIARELERVRSGRMPEKPKSVTEEGEADPFLVTWDSKESLENPRNWSIFRKARVMAAVSLFSLMGPYSSSMVSPASQAIARYLKTPNETEQVLLVSIFVLAYMFGPLFSSPISESYGRRPVLLVCNAMFVCANQLYVFQPRMRVGYEFGANDCPSLLCRTFCWQCPSNGWRHYC